MSAVEAENVQTNNRILKKKLLQKSKKWFCVMDVKNSISAACAMSLRICNKWV
jgi:Tfp pilus assembly protein PilW